MSEKLDKLIVEFEKSFEPEFYYGGLAAIKPNYKAQQEARQAIVDYVHSLESELAALKESTRWIPVDYEPAPKDLDNYGACSDVEGNAYWVRKPTEAK
jgi:hypothetical protein